MLKCVAIDDEPLALEIIRNYVGKLNDTDIVATFTDTVSAKAFLDDNNVDLLFLDIQMPDINGMRFYAQLAQKPPVIFTTAFSQYAVEGFNLDAIDYLVKPIEFERFSKAVTKAKELQEYHQNKEMNDGYLFVKYNYQWNKIFFKDIILIEALDDYIKIHMQPKSLLVHMSMKAVTEKLPSQKFVRVHRSYIVPVDGITSFNKNTLQLGDKQIPVSSSYQKQVQEILQKRIEQS